MSKDQERCSLGGEESACRERAKAEQLKSKMAANLSEQTAAHDAQRRRDAETIAAMVKKQRRTRHDRRSEAELAALKRLPPRTVRLLCTCMCL